MPRSAPRTRTAGSLLLRLALVLLIAWAGAALWIDGPQPRALAGALACIFLISSLGAVLIMTPGRATWLVGAGFVAVLIWWSMLPPRNDRVWMADVACPSLSDRRGDVVTLYNVRNFTWRSDDDFDVAWETRGYRLSEVVGLDLLVSKWGPDAIAHTIMSWEFADGRHLAISIETRKQQGEEYSALRGFFRQYELFYAVADERDLIGVRARCRGEDLHLYRLPAPPERARRLLLEYLDRIDRLATEPEWYNALTHNCTTTIFTHVKPLVGRVPFDWRILMNGRIDELLYEHGVLDHSMPLDELRERSRVTEAARAASEPGAGGDFSAAIRAGLPPRPLTGAVPGP
jgi:hypothetical protein